MSVEKWGDMQVLARTVWGEARGEGNEGMEAVARVIVNRYKAKKWFTGYVIENGKKVPSIKETCLKKYQFSCWNKNDANYQKLLIIDEEDKSFAKCLKVAEAAVTGNLVDFINNATFYHTKSIKPNWALHHAPCFESGNHLFYNDIK